MEKRPDTSSPARSRKEFLAAALFTTIGILTLGYWKPGQEAAKDFHAHLKDGVTSGEELPFKVEPERRAVSRKST